MPDGFGGYASERPEKPDTLTDPKTSVIRLDFEFPMNIRARRVPHHSWWVPADMNDSWQPQTRLGSATGAAPSPRAESRGGVAQGSPGKRPHILPLMESIEARLARIEIHLTKNPGEHVGKP